MTTPDTAAIRAQMETLDGFTPGPWDWEVSRRSQTVELCGGKGASDLTVMSFARWGLNKAAPVFWFWRGNVSDEPKRAEALGTPEPGREHHADWFQRINHPNARLIAAAPDMRETILALCEALDELRAENERLQTIIGNLHVVEKQHRATINYQFSRAVLLQAENERLRAALETFADADKYYDPSFDDDYSPRWAEFFTIGDFRRARAALAQKEGK